MAYIAEIETITLSTLTFEIKTNFTVKSSSSQKEPTDIRYVPRVNDNISSMKYRFVYDRILITSEEPFIVDLEYKIEIFGDDFSKKDIIVKRIRIESKKQED